MVGFLLTNEFTFDIYTNTIMPILLKNLIENTQPNKIQLYLDLDGVMADIDTGFGKISGGYNPRNFKDSPEFNGNDALARKKFWKLVDKTPDFWLNLPLCSDAKVLWRFIHENFTNPPPVILIAGQGSTLTQQKTQWVHTHLDPKVKVIISASGPKKPDYIMDNSPDIMNILVDDTDKNIVAWNDPSKNRFAIKHTSAADSINQLNKFL